MQRCRRAGFIDDSVWNLLPLFPAYRFSFERNGSRSIEYGGKEEVILLGCFLFNGQCNIYRFTRIIGAVFIFDVQSERILLLRCGTVIVFVAGDAGCEQQGKKNLFHGA